MPDTPLGNVVAIRSENDPEQLKNFNAAQRKIRDDWRKKNAPKVDEKTEMDALFRAALA